MSTQSKWQQLATEAVNPRTRHLDALPAGEMVERMLLDNRHVLGAVRREKVRIARAAVMMAEGVRQGGRLIFVGAGTSGRLGVLEAAELPPTFGIAPETAIAIMAGGPAAVHRAKEGVEDDFDEGAKAVRRLRPRPKDVVVGISASGITPFVRGALTQARKARSRIIGVTCDARSELKELSDIAIVLRVGPEVIAGSTRLKAGTATKVVLNMLTTTAMVRVGKTYGNLMVDVKSNSEKLRDRASRIIGAVTGLAPEDAYALLRRSGWHPKVAILMHLAGVTRAQAASRLRVEPRLRKLLGRR
jgi:N-acetylmuramic acid 6-phosphate etherase